MKIGVVLCTCGKTLNIDFDRVENYVKSLDGVVKVKRVDLLCKNPEQHLEDFKGLDGIVFACCSERSSLTFNEDAMAKTAEKLGIDPAMYENANIREQCAWIHDKETATLKAMDLIAMACEKLKMNAKAFKAEFAKRALVIGGGVAGLSCAKSLAELGIDVTLVEEKPYLGGHACQIPLLWQSEGTASVCTSECVIPVINREVLLDERIEVLTNSSVVSVDRVNGNFKVKIEKKPQYVKPELCISCGKCSEVCPVEIPNPFEFGFKKRKAIDKDFSLAMPDSYNVVIEACNECGECLKVCPTNAIDLNAKPEVVEKEFGAIVIATGFKGYDMTAFEKLNYKSPKVVTLMEFERLIANDFYGDIPLSVVFVLCQKDEVKYCSRLCCPATVKLVNRLLLMHPEIEITVLYKSLRTYGRAFEEFRRLAEKKGVEFVQAEVKAVEEGEECLRVVTDKEEFEADLVVLAEPLVPSELRLMKMLGVKLDDFGFPIEFQPRVINPDESYAERIFLAGTAKGFKDVQESIESGRAVAVKVYQALKGKTAKFVSITNTERCSRCGLCIAVCPHSAIRLGDTAEILPEFCKGCGLCYATCPSSAIRLVNLEDEQILRMAEVAFKHSEKPRILAFLCYWCSYAAGDLMGVKGLKLPPFRSIRIRCSASINPDVVARILLENKADGIIIAGCPPKNCHHLYGNYIQDRRIKMLKNVLKELGIDDRRVRFEYIGVAMWGKLAKIIKAMYEDLKG